MRIFKYLFLTLILFSSSSVFAFTYYTVDGSTKHYSSALAACQSKIGEYRGAYGQNIASVSIRSSWECNAFAASGQFIGTISYSQGVITCPSATSVDLKVPTNAQTYQCVQGCQYRLRACVDVDFEAGMTCSAISTGADCGAAPPPKTPAPGTTTPDSDGTPAAPGQTSTGTNTNTATTTGTSTSTTTTTTDSSGNTTTNTTTNITNNTTLDLSSLESTIRSVGAILGAKLDAIKEALGGDSGGDTGTPDGNGTDLTETNSKLDDIKKNGDDLNNWLQGKNEDGTGGGVGDNPFGTDTTPERQLTAQTFETNIFSSNASCPADRTLSMTLFTGKSFSKSFSFSMWCDKLAIFGYFILLAAYGYAAYIVVSKS